eukprot:6434741-Alexandrium_andersonii.AAC.1
MGARSEQAAAPGGPQASRTAGLPVIPLPADSTQRISLCSETGREQIRSTRHPCSTRPPASTLSGYPSHGWAP